MYFSPHAGIVCGGAGGALKGPVPYLLMQLFSHAAQKSKFAKLEFKYVHHSMTMQAMHSTFYPVILFFPI